MRVNQTRAWNTGNGSPDAICFTVDRPGVTLVGVCVYGGLGNYEYSVELLHDVRVRGITPEPLFFLVVKYDVSGSGWKWDC